MKDFFFYGIISSLCEDKAAQQPSAALPLIILFAIRDCSYQSREVNAAFGVASFPCRHGIINFAKRNLKPLCGSQRSLNAGYTIRNRRLLIPQSDEVNTRFARASFVCDCGIISAQGADKAALRLSAFKERWLYYS